MSHEADLADLAWLEPLASRSASYVRDMTAEAADVAARRSLRRRIEDTEAALAAALAAGADPLNRPVLKMGTRLAGLAIIERHLATSAARLVPYHRHQSLVENLGFELVGLGSPPQYVAELVHWHAEHQDARGQTVPASAMRAGRATFDIADHAPVPTNLDQLAVTAFAECAAEGVELADLRRHLSRQLEVWEPVGPRVMAWHEAVTSERVRDWPDKVARMRAAVERPTASAGPTAWSTSARAGPGASARCRRSRPAPRGMPGPLVWSRHERQRRPADRGPQGHRAGPGRGL
jgi:hypothetical protein